MAEINSFSQLTRNYQIPHAILPRQRRYAGDSHVIMVIKHNSEYHLAYEINEQSAWVLLLLIVTSIGMRCQHYKTSIGGLVSVS